MKNLSKLIAVALTSAALLFTSSVKAQTTPANAWRLGIGLETGVPTGIENEHHKFELGGTARLQYGISSQFALTLTSGYYNFFPTTNPVTGTDYKTIDIVPVKLGFKEFFAKNIYFGGEAGAGFVTTTGLTKFVWSPGLGYAGKNLDIGVRYEGFDGQGLDFGVIGLRIAYGFSL